MFHNADNKGSYSNGDAAVGGGGGGTRLLFDDGSTNIMHDDANPPTKFSPQVGVDAVLAAVEAEMRVALTAAGADRRDRRPIDIEHALAANEEALTASAAATAGALAGSMVLLLPSTRRRCPSVVSV